MLIGGLQKFSLLDYPGHLSAIIFTQGCNFRCQFCYNPMLVWPRRGSKLKYFTPPSSREDGGARKDQALIKAADLFVFLAKRYGKLDAAVISGGEPTLQRDLPRFIKKIKALGYLVKLDTNGTNPTMLRRLLKEKSIDYIAMDIKNSPAKYKKTIGANFDLAKIKKSIKIIKESGLPYEFRTTVVPALINRDDIEIIGGLLAGAEQWFLQQFKSDTDLVNPEYEGTKIYSDKEMKGLRQTAKKHVKKCEIR